MVEPRREGKNEGVQGRVKRLHLQVIHPRQAGSRSPRHLSKVSIWNVLPSSPPPSLSLSKNTRATHPVTHSPTHQLTFTTTHSQRHSLTHDDHTRSYTHSAIHTLNHTHSYSLSRFSNIPYHLYTVSLPVCNLRDLSRCNHPHLHQSYEQGNNPC